MTKNNLPPLFDSADKITPLYSHGVSGAEKWIMQSNGKKYFVKKILATNDTYLSKELVDRVNTKTKIFPNIVAECEKDGFRYTAFEYIEGADFSKLSSTEITKKCKNVAKKLKMLQNFKFFGKKIKFAQIVKQCQSDINYFFSKRRNPFLQSKTDFLLMTHKYSQSFKNHKMRPIHGDMKPDNCIFAEDVYFVDVDSPIKSYFAMNFVYSAQMLFDADSSKSLFIRNVIDDYYNHHIPKYFFENLRFVLIKKFFNRMRIFIDDGNKSDEEEFIELYKHIFDNFDKVQDIFSNS